MYSYNNKQFIFKQSSGKVWNFFYDDKNGLCYSILTKRNTWSEPVCLQKNLHPSFFAALDNDDCFFIMFQDRQGNIFCSRINNDVIKTTPVLNSKKPSSYNKYLSLIPAKNLINIFFVLEHNENFILAHQLLNEGSAGMPKVVDYLAGNDIPYSAVSDYSGNIYAFYQSSDGKYLQIGYKRYIHAQKTWSEFIPVSRFRGDCTYPRAISDNRGIIHLCYQRRNENQQYELIYQQKPYEKNAWTNDKIIHSSVYAYPEASIASISDNLFIFWVRDEVIYYCSSNDGGNSFSKASKYVFYPGRQFYCIGYKSNNSFENEKTAIREIPGNFTGGFKLAFYQDYVENIVNLSADELKNMIVESLKMIRANLDELKEQFNTLKDSVSGMSINQENFERDMTKNSLKINLIENEINRIKNIGIEMEDYAGIIGEMKSRLAGNSPDLTGAEIWKRNYVPVQNHSSSFPISKSVFSDEKTIPIPAFYERTGTKPESIAEGESGEESEGGSEARGESGSEEGRESGSEEGGESESGESAKSGEKAAVPGEVETGTGEVETGTGETLPD